MHKMNFLTRFFIPILSLFIFGCDPDSVGPKCREDNCAKISDKINDFCVANGFAGKPYLVVRGENDACYCKCVAEDTKVHPQDRYHGSEVQKLNRYRQPDMRELDRHRQPDERR